MRINKKAGCFLGILIWILLTGCSREHETMQKEENNMKDPLVTETYLIEQCGVEPSELEGIDVDAFIKEYDIRESNAGKVNLSFLIETYREKKEEEPYAYLLNVEYEAEGLQKDALSSVMVAALYITEGTYQETIIMDQRSGAAYWGKAANLLNYFTEDCIKTAWTEEKETKFQELLMQTEIFTWKMKYEGSSQDTTGSFGWALYLETEDGKCYRYSGQGVMGDNTPEHWNTFVDEVKELVKE